MTKLRSAVCPSCGVEVSVTYWPYNIPLYTVHGVQGATRDCRLSLRPVGEDAPKAPPKKS